MKEVAKVLNEMVRDGVIENYAIFGALAQMSYTEPVATLDADVRVALPGQGDSLDVLSPIYEYCRKRGYFPEGEAIRIGNWPVQFIPVFDSLTGEALEKAEAEDFEGEPLRIVRADHLAAIALKTGRPKDYARVLSLLDSGAVSAEEIKRLCDAHGIGGQWERFSEKFLER